MAAVRSGSRVLAGAVALVLLMPASAHASTTAPPDAGAKAACAQVRALTEKGTPASVKDLTRAHHALGSSTSSGAKKIGQALKVSGKKRARNRALKKAAAWCHGNGAWLNQLERGQTAYFLITSETNSAGDALNKRRSSETTQQYCAEAGTLDEKFAQDLQAYTDWPADAKNAIVALETAVAAESGLYFQCSHDPASVANASIDDAQNKSGAAASAVRLLLHLPINR
jgi:hypothetical protein